MTQFTSEFTKVFPHLINRRVSIIAYHHSELDRLYPLREDADAPDLPPLGAQAHFEAGVRAYASCADLLIKLVMELAGVNEEWLKEEKSSAKNKGLANLVILINKLDAGGTGDAILEWRSCPIYSEAISLRNKVVHYYIDKERRGDDWLVPVRPTNHDSIVDRGMRGYLGAVLDHGRRLTPLVSDLVAPYVDHLIPAGQDGN